MSVDSFLLFFYSFSFSIDLQPLKTNQSMRIFFVSAFLLLVGIAVMTVCRMKNKQYLSELALVNVEALATGEGDVPTSCYGSGNVDCPISDSKVSYVMNGRSF